jgi:phage terminase large subunit GpA-like protein
MSLPDWCAAHVQTDSGAPFVPFAFQREILEGLGDPTVSEVVWLKPSRVGGTAIATGWALLEIEQGRRLGYVNPRQEDAESFSTEIIGPAIENCAPVSGLLRPAKEGGRNAATQKQFRNRTVFKSLHAAPASARRHNLDSIALDEVEAWRQTSEGNLVDLFRKRVNASARPKIFTASTPVERVGLVYLAAVSTRRPARF